MNSRITHKHRNWRVGALAAATGVTVRALHHYEEVGLLQSCGRTSGGHRVYDAEGVARIYQIRALRGLGLSLSEISGVIGSGRPLEEILGAHLDRVGKEIDRLGTLRDRLKGLVTASTDGIDVEGLLATLDAMSRVERQAHRRRDSKPKAVKTLEARWRALARELREFASAGVDPAEPDVRKVACHARQLINQFAGGDDRITEALALLRVTSLPHDFFGWDPELVNYLEQALAGTEGDE